MRLDPSTREGSGRGYELGTRRGCASYSLRQNTHELLERLERLAELEIELHLVDASEICSHAAERAGSTCERAEEARCIERERDVPEILGA
jgi:hypothetical protein